MVQMIRLGVPAWFGETTLRVLPRQCSRTRLPGPASSGLPSNTPGSQRPGAAARISPWPYEPGHGLWLVRQIADHISVNRGPAGSQVTVAFTMLRGGIP
jgi:hypothetical protein